MKNPLLEAFFSNLVKMNCHPIAEPGQLALGKTARILLELFKSLFKALLPLEIREELLVANPLRRLNLRMVLI